MEQLALLNFIVGCIVIGCVGYSLVSAVLWLLSLFGGVCLGC